MKAIYIRLSEFYIFLTNVIESNDFIQIIEEIHMTGNSTL